MKSGKVPGPTGMTSDLMKKVGVIRELTSVFGGIIDEEEITVMEEASKLARGDGPWEQLHADDLVLTAE
ncbi:hypothetical protein E2C01_064166 [Portunus trituberculatus]|uniref:Uncharacterized protein n=1 Tax=Portunus trituberculatus TaxID=210409 RepID=A0A5B7HIC4_PORTR|nr:hypothetical protein [Portunus trituberculatus]